MLYFALMTLFIAKILVFFGWLWKEPVNYWSRCSNWRPFAFTHARSRALHWSTASSTTHCGHRRIAGGAWGCYSTPKLLEKSEIF